MCRLWRRAHTRTIPESCSGGEGGSSLKRQVRSNEKCCNFQCVGAMLKWPNRIWSRLLPIQLGSFSFCLLNFSSPILSILARFRRALPTGSNLISNPPPYLCTTYWYFVLRVYIYSVGGRRIDDSFILFFSYFSFPSLFPGDGTTPLVCARQTPPPPLGWYEMTRAPNLFWYSTRRSASWAFLPIALASLFLLQLLRAERPLRFHQGIQAHPLIYHHFLHSPSFLVARLFFSRYFISHSAYPSIFARVSLYFGRTGRPSWSFPGGSPCALCGVAVVVIYLFVWFMCTAERARL